MTTKELAKEISFRIQSKGYVCDMSRSQVSHASKYFGRPEDGSLIEKTVNYYFKHQKFPRVSDAKKDGPSPAEINDMQSAVDLTYSMSDNIRDALNSLKLLSDMKGCFSCLEDIVNDLYTNDIEDKLQIMLGKVAAFRQKLIDKIGS